MTAEQKAARPPAQMWLPALKPALIFECVGVPGVIQQIFEGAPRDARIVVVGVCMETDRSEPMLGIMKELSVQYVLGYTPTEFASSLQLLADGKVDAASLITGKVGIDGVAQAFDGPRQSREAHENPGRALAVKPALARREQPVPDPQVAVAAVLVAVLARGMMESEAHLARTSRQNFVAVDRYGEHAADRCRSAASPGNRGHAAAGAAEDAVFMSATLHLLEVTI